MLISLSVVFAQSLSVPPIEAARRSRSTRGLGDGLAELLKQDLQLIPAIELTDRDGQWTLQGTYELADRRLHLVYNVADASGNVVAGTEHEGSAGDYLTVVKAASVALASNLGHPPSAGIQRRMLAVPATESLTSLQVYGRGLQLAADGNHERALASYEAALAVDPAFTLALRALAVSRRAVEEQGLSVSDEAMLARTAKLEKALTKLGPEQEKTGAATVGQFVNLGLRWSVLTELSRHCEVAEEIEHFLLRTGGKLPPNYQGNYKSARGQAKATAGLGGGLDRLEAKIEDEIALPKPPEPNANSLLAGRQLSLLNATLACAGSSPRAQIPALESLQTFASSLGLADAEENFAMPPALEILTYLTAARAMSEGDTQRVVADLAQLRSAPLLARRRLALHRRLDQIAQVAVKVGEARSLLAPLGFGDLLSVAGAFVDESPTDPRCAAVAPKRGWVRALQVFETTLMDGAVTGREIQPFIHASIPVISASILGCVHDGDAHFGLGEADAWFDGLRPAESHSRLVDPAMLAGWFTEEEPDPLACDDAPVREGRAVASRAKPTRCEQHWKEVTESVQTFTGAPPERDAFIVRKVVGELALHGCVRVLPSAAE